MQTTCMVSTLDPHVKQIHSGSELWVWLCPATHHTATKAEFSRLTFVTKEQFVTREQVHPKTIIEPFSLQLRSAILQSK